MAVSVVNSSSLTQAAQNNLPITYPASISKNNLLIAVVNAPSSNTMVAPTGWNLLATASGSTAFLWYKRATGDEGGSDSWNWTTNSVSCGIIVNLTGNAIGNGVDGTPTSNANGASTNKTAPTITPRYTADMLLNIYTDTSANAITVPGGQSNTGGAQGNTMSIIAGYETLSAVPVAATGTRVATNAGNTANTCFSLCISPAIVAGTLLPAGVFAINDIPKVTKPISGAVAGVIAQNGLLAIAGGTIGVAGGYKIAGTVTSNGAPARKRVFICLRNSPGTVLAETYSDATTGLYTFTGLGAATYDVWAQDPNNVYNNVSAAIIVSVPS